MTETQCFLIDIIKIVPDGSVCFIQAPSLDNFEFQKLMNLSEFIYFQQVILTSENKELLSELIKLEQIEQYFHSLEIRSDGDLLIRGTDGMEMGIFSSKLDLPSDFENKYTSLGMCLISND